MLLYKVKATLDRMFQEPGGGAKLKYKIVRLNDMQDVPETGGWSKSKTKIRHYRGAKLN